MLKVPHLIQLNNGLAASAGSNRGSAGLHAGGRGHFYGTGARQ